MSESRLLALLADGEFHSGQELGEILGVSRSAIWKRLQKLGELGIEVYRVKGRGYRIPGGLDLLDSERVMANLSADVKARLEYIELLGEVDSTNRCAQQGLRSGLSRVLYSAEFQSAGRGRRGRQWVSPYGANLCLTLGWRFSGGVAALEGLSLAVGVALSEAIAEFGIDTIQLKWPNDLQVDGHKLAGILIELSGDASGDCEIMVGCGINVHMTEQLLAQVDQPTTSLDQQTEQPLDRSALLAAIGNHLVALLDSFADTGFEAWQSRWKERDALVGKRVNVSDGRHGVIEGICCGVTPSGALRVDVNGEIQIFHGGEVSVRAAHNTGD